MKKTILLILLLALGLLLFKTTDHCTMHNNDTLFQVSTIDALLAGLYDGEITIGELKNHGNLGIGTFHALDGEMLAVDGMVYRIASDGKASVVDDQVKTPFAAVTPFEEDLRLNILSDVDYDSLKIVVDQKLPSPNIFYAFKIKGVFQSVKTRSVPKQEKPYGPLIEIVKAQSKFNFENIKGSMVGFRCPPYVKGINIPGYHLHFLTEDGSAGGHVMEFTIENAAVSIDETAAFSLILPQNEDFYELDLTGDKEAEVRKVER